MKRVGFFCPPECLFHETGPRHPERPARLAAIQDRLTREHEFVAFMDSAPADEQDLLRVHSKEHIERVRTLCEVEEELDADTPVCCRSWEAALFAVGAGISAARAIGEGTISTAFCAVRPPGHHAERERAMGFCLFNNVAIVARWFQQVAAIQRIAILDWDVHHGNGTQNIFQNDPTVFYASIHQFPHYPGTGAEHEQNSHGTLLNIPMRPRIDPEQWVIAIRDRVVPAFRSFEPEVVLISCGFDAHHCDPLADQLLDETHFADMTRALGAIGCKRVVSVLEGGYHLEALASSALAHVQGLTKLSEGQAI